ncbi:hypothetical protein [Marinobacter sp.]
MSRTSLHRRTVLRAMAGTGFLRPVAGVSSYRLRWCSKSEGVVQA